MELPFSEMRNTVGGMFCVRVCTFACGERELGVHFVYLKSEILPSKDFK